MSVNVKIVGLNRLTKLAERYPATSEKYVGTAIQRALTRILGQEKQEAPFGVSGMLRDNWRITTGRFEGALVSLTPYASYVHDGTAPHMPPVKELEAWAKKKGISPWAVAMSIKKKGTKANPFLQRSVDEVKDGIESDFEKALNDALNELAALDDA